MENQFTVGNSYKIEEIENAGFVKTRQTTVVVFYRKDRVLMAFDIPKPLAPKKHKLLSVCTD